VTIRPSVFRLRASVLKRFLLCVSVSLWFVCGPDDAAYAQVSSGFSGTWALNQDKSTFEPLDTRPLRRVVILEMKGNELSHRTSTQRMRILDVEPFQEVSTAQVSYTAKFDGREYPVPNSSSTIKLKRMNATTFERVATSGTASETATWTLSPDGRTLTVTAKGVDAEGMPFSSTQVYDRQ
jgi:hypothetical protein